MRDEAEHKGDSRAVGLGRRQGRDAEGVSSPAPPRDLVGKVLPGEAATLRAAQEALDGDRHGLRALWPFLGPAFIASVAYLDPGNFATDIAGGAKYGYLLLWAVLASNLMAMLVQTLSAKLGIATGRNLAEVCRDEFPRRVSFGLWLQAEVDRDGDRPRGGARRRARLSACFSGSRSAGAPSSPSPPPF